jgi:drug/metabolite transporter (DMT)-like permease
LLGNKVRYILFFETNTTALTFIVFLSGGLLAMIASWIQFRDLSFTAPEWKAGIVTGLCNSIGTILLLGAMRISSTVVFPISSSIALLGGVFLTTLIYKELMGTLNVIGIAVGTAALILAVFRDSLVAILG